MPLLEVQDLTKRFGGVTAVDSLTFSVGESETVSIIGPNGAGKTTVFNLITGFHQPTRGRVLFEGRDMVGHRPYQVALAGIGRTFQIVKPLRGLTVFENILVGAFARTDHRSHARDVTEEILGFTGLAQMRDAIAHSLPLAMRKRLELARSLATRPRVILLDEVMAGLNPTESREAVELIKRLKNERGISAVAGVEHVMHVVMSISDRIVVLNQGRKIAEGKPDEIAANKEVIAAYLGE